MEGQSDLPALSSLIIKQVEAGEHMKEVWKDIEGYEGKYEVSNFGRIKSLPRNGTIKSPRIMVLSNDRDGYKLVTLCGKTQRVHRLVASVFLPADSLRKHINHKDGDKSNNFIENLEWVTITENNQHRCRVLGYKGTPHHCKKVRSMEDGKTYNSLRDAERATGAKRQNIINAILRRHRTKTAGGYHWEIVE